MSSNYPRVTAYQEYVFSNLPQAVESGAGLYNYQELAALVGLKPTGNFRRRVRQLVTDGKLILAPAFTPRGGIEARFMSPEKYKTEGIPF